ncbi:MAG: hypothetical protein Q9198_010731, partial [Flavoplaca austrocitrina]
HKRTRFVGLRNTDQAGMWATLDRDILMKATPRGFFTSKDADLAFGGPEDSGFAKFPFGVLEVRFEGGSETEFLSVLDKTHLVIRDMWERERRDLFADRYRPRGFELPALDQDLRKIPATVKTATARLSSNRLSPSPTSTAKNSVSATSNGERPASSGFSAPMVESSATSVPEILGPSYQKASKKKRRPREDRQVPQQLNESREYNHHRYWNEYDDGDENLENEPFAIYVNPHQKTPLFDATSTLASQVRGMSIKAKQWLRLADKNASKTTSETGSTEDDSDLENSVRDPLLSPQKQHIYSTFQRRHAVDHATKAQALLLTRCCMAFYTASFVLLIVAALLAASGRRKAHLEVDVGVITGVVFSLIFAVAA